MTEKIVPEKFKGVKGGRGHRTLVGYPGFPVPQRPSDMYTRIQELMSKRAVVSVCICARGSLSFDYFLRRLVQNIPAKPGNMRAMVAGSGTTGWASFNAARVKRPLSTFRSYINDWSMSLNLK